MNWKDILKNVITQGKIKEIEDIDIDIEDDDCKRELKRLADKLKNYKSVIGKKWNTGWHENYSKEGKLIMEDYPIADGDGKRFTIRNTTAYGYPLIDFLIYYVYKLDDTPESVACRALEMLKEEKTDNENIEINGTYYRIERTFSRKFPVITEKYFSNHEIVVMNGVQVYKNGVTVLLIESILEAVLNERASGVAADLKFADRWHR